MANIANGTNGGRHIVNEPLTTAATLEASPDLLRNSVDERIVHIHPMATPIDQLSRCAGARKCGSMVVEYYSVDTKKTETELTEDVSENAPKPGNNNTYGFTIGVKDASIFDTSDTVLFPSAIISTGANKGQPLICYVQSVITNKIKLIPVNPIITEGAGCTIPAMKSGDKVARMGRAATELDVMTPQYAALPTKAFNNCQIFKMQVEQSTLQKIADKEVGWNFSDQEEAAVIDMRLGMEKNFLFGSRAKIFDPIKNEYIYLTGGIWNQAGKEYTIDTPLDDNELITLCAEAFTHSNGSKRKILVGGSKLIEAISKIKVNRVIMGDRAFVKWGIEFHEISTNFGSLFIIHSEIFDQCGHEKDGLIIDPDFITKYTHIPFKIDKLDLRSSGTRNTDAVVLTEASCLVLRLPTTHMRIIGEAIGN